MRTIIISLFTISISQVAAAESTPDSSVEEDIKAFHNAPEKQETTIEIDPLDEEGEFVMDLTMPTPVSQTVDPDAELSSIVTTELTPSEINNDLGEIVEGAPIVNDAAKDIEWNFDLSEDLELGDEDLKIEEEEKSEPVNLDYLEE